MARLVVGSLLLRHCARLGVVVIGVACLLCVLGALLLLLTGHRCGIRLCPVVAPLPAGSNTGSGPQNQDQSCE